MAMACANVVHHPPVPVATFNRQGVEPLGLRPVLYVDRHERGEYTEVDGEKPYAPLHGPGDNPYVVHELATGSPTAHSMDRRGQARNPKRITLTTRSVCTRRITPTSCQGRLTDREFPGKVARSLSL